MNIKSVKLYGIKMPLKVPFTTHLGTVSDREGILIEVIGQDGISGYGEAVAFSSPWYTEETIQTCLHMLKDFLIPLVSKQTISHPEEATALFSSIKRNQMAKASIEMAFWDLHAKRQNMPLAKLLGGTRTSVPAGVVVGTKTIQESIRQIQDYLAKGYTRVKVKINPGNDFQLLSEIRQNYPFLQLMADANSAYTLDDTEQLKVLDQFNLLMIEQPLGHDDIVEHAVLQRSLKTPICLDESIISLDDARKAAGIQSCRVINIKPGRVGGLGPAKKIHDFCMLQGIKVWCGGMLEFGVSRAHNIALSSLSGFTIPGDLSSSSRYWEEDIILPEISVENGYVSVPDKPGIGFDLNWKRINETLIFEEEYIL
ncbi:o-succinylbenzoate synthase [Mesobacillus harenae]|uniref:o-succinylbenzoate synthase n=1 Tax=Mesobacillus harenae TaxID=2213203 RepID=UPI0015803DE5